MVQEPCAYEIGSVRWSFENVHTWMIILGAAAVSFGKDGQLSGRLVPVSWGQVEVVVRPLECIVLRQYITGKQPEGRGGVEAAHRREARVV